MFEKILNPIFAPLLKLGYFWSILLISFILTLIITLVYKYATDQTLMKKLKTEMKTFQAEMKKFKDNPSKVMAHQKKIMSKNMEYMKHSLKPTLFTFIPIIIVFGWLNAHLTYLPIQADSQFQVLANFKEGTFGNITLEVLPELTFLSNHTQTIDGNKAVWSLKGQTGDYQLKFSFGNREFQKDLIISLDNYALPDTVVKDSDLTKLSINNQRVKPFGSISIFGWKPGWLGTYIIFSLIFSFGLRKLLNIS